MSSYPLKNLSSMLQCLDFRILWCAVMGAGGCTGAWVLGVRSGAFGCFWVLVGVREAFGCVRVCSVRACAVHSGVHGV